MFKFLEKHRYKFVNSLVFKVTWSGDYIEYITYELYETAAKGRKVEIKTVPELMRQAKTCAMYHMAILPWLRGVELHESWFAANKNVDRENTEKGEADIIKHPNMKIIYGGKGKEDENKDGND